jgi:hypothetical protein
MVRSPWRHGCNFRANAGGTAGAAASLGGERHPVGYAWQARFARPAIEPAIPEPRRARSSDEAG